MKRGNGYLKSDRSAGRKPTADNRLRRNTGGGTHRDSRRESNTAHPRHEKQRGDIENFGISRRKFVSKVMAAGALALAPLTHRAYGQALFGLPTEESSLPVDYRGNKTLGFAVRNVSGQPANARIILLDKLNRKYGERDQTIADGQNLGGYVEDYFPSIPSGFQGELSLITDGLHQSGGFVQTATSMEPVASQPVAHDPDRARVVVQHYDLALLRPTSELGNAPGVTPVTGNAKVIVDGKEHVIPPNGKKLWLSPGAHAMDASHPQYWNDVTIARTDPATWSTIGIKDNTPRDLEVIIETTQKGQSMDLALMQMRDLEQLHYRVPLLPVEHYLTKEDLIPMLQPSIAKYHFYDPQHIKGWTLNWVGTEAGEFTLGIMRQYVGYQNTLSPLVQITLGERPPEWLGSITLVAENKMFNSESSGTRDYEIGDAIAYVDVVSLESQQWGGAASEILSATTMTGDLYLRRPDGGVWKVDLGNMVFGLPGYQIIRGQPFNEVGKQIAGMGLNLDRGAVLRKYL